MHSNPLHDLLAKVKNTAGAELQGHPSPHQPLMVVPPEQRELFHAVDAARVIADRWGGAPAICNVNKDLVLARINKIGSDLPIQVQRDETNKMGICTILVDLCNKAFTLNYDIDSDAVFKKLFWVASTMYSSEYRPMRVLGATAEGMVKKGK